MKLRLVWATSVQTRVGVVLAAVHCTLPAGPVVMEVVLPTAAQVAVVGVERLGPVSATLRSQQTRKLASQCVVRGKHARRRWVKRSTREARDTDNGN